MVNTQQNELSAREQTTSVPALLDKVMRYRPRVLCFIGLGIARIVQAQLCLETSVIFHHHLYMGQWLIYRPQNGKNKRLVQSKEGLQTYKVMYPDCKPHGMHPKLFVNQVSLLFNPGICETLFYAIPCTSGRVVHFQVCSQNLSSLTRIQSLQTRDRTKSSSSPIWNSLLSSLNARSWTHKICMW